jgi:hypothetical protein
VTDENTAPETGDAEVPEAAQEQTLNGVMVQRHDMPDGNFGTSITVVGDCRKSEIITLLKLALRGAEADVAQS